MIYKVPGKGSCALGKTINERIKKMKKVMIAACAVAMSAVAQAASISWGAAAANVGAGGPESAAGQYAYLLYSDSAFSALATSIAIAGNGADAVGGNADNGGKIVAFHQIGEEEGENGSFLAGFNRADADGGVNGYYQIILADADNKKFAVAQVANPVTGISDTTSAGEAKFNVNWDTDEFIGANGFNGGITSSIPEPTSGLLLLIGMAGLALKRKRA